ncbi:hypothetical protein A4D02_35530 [Niastella koreensis]|uniref:PNPLA domain-containing protein n=2 Tax=Niastella koreensis TaxID=354356 RepID=G8TJE9_NIAKG|nr:patatin-like phospholipase family protein [Niastella koreensis]AEV99684.1 hypothetical protein Niako_3376 [Niastella koreensis GR20-10]OQP44289.1 hypothetical protein A4D02_35530 [Niastella koreensis]
MATDNPKAIRLGICMAGAVSAGAYTAGVVDYLIETLERWQQKKEQIQRKLNQGEALTEMEKLVPLHNVVIEVLSGASAGGMTAAVLAYSFNDGSYYTKKNNDIIARNYNIPDALDTPTKLYDVWVNMADDEKGSTFKKLMNTDDVMPLNNMKSLLNSAPIDRIAEKAIPRNIQFNPPKYVSEYVSVLLSITNLEGIPIDIRFSNIDSNNPTCNVLKMHSGFLHYQFKGQSLFIDYPAEIITEATKGHLAVAAKATGAFPFGLSNRKIVVNRMFFEDFKNRLKLHSNMNVNLKLPEDKNYVFNAVDGGAINNEPIGTTMRILDCKKKEYHPDDENYMILIDPFPTVTNAAKRDEYCEPKEYTLLEQAKKIVKAFRNQSMFKQEDLLNGLEMEHKRYLIYPIKRKFYFLACGLIEGFSGFFKKEFREHDYQLGRKNCQAFLRFYFGESLEKYRQITNYNITEEQFIKWRYNINYGKADVPELWRMPLIPDLLRLNSEDEIETPQYNGLTSTELATANKLIKKRIEKVVNASYPAIQKAGKSINIVVGWLLKFFSRYMRKKISSTLYDKSASYLSDTFYPQTLKQEDLLLFFIQKIQAKGRLYQKTKGVWARISAGGEQIVSWTSDGRETSNITSVGDYVLQNDTKIKEEYIVKPDKFQDRYIHEKENYYVPNQKARVYAIQLTAGNIAAFKLEGLQQLIDNPSNPIYIEAPWHESQALRLDDYLVIPLAKNEVYRIGQKEFVETYKIV